MAYKALGDRKRQEAIVNFLEIASDLDGHLVAVAIDKRKKWLSTGPNSHTVIRDYWQLQSSWNARSLEAMMRKIHMVVALLPLWSEPFGNVTWITDQDEFVGNDRRHDDALAVVSKFSKLYLQHSMGKFALHTTSQDKDGKDFEDLCSVPDLAAGMISEVAAQLTADGTWEDRIRRVVQTDLPTKAQLLADWFWDGGMRLRKTMISLDVVGDQYGLRKVWMEPDQ